MNRRGLQRTETISDPVLKRIFEVMPRWRGPYDLCREVPANLSNFCRQRKKGNPISKKLIRIVCERSGARREYLVLGELPMFEAEGQRVTALPDEVQEIIQLLREVPVPDRRVVTECARLVSLRQSADIATLAAIARSLQHMSQLALSNTAIDPDDPLRRSHRSQALKSR